MTDRLDALASVRRSMNRYGSPQRTTIANGNTTSSEIDLSDSITAGIALPAAFTGTSMTFQVATQSGGTFQVLEDQYGVPVTLTVEQGKSYTLPNELAPWPYVKLVSGSSEAAERTLRIVRKR